MEQDFSEDDYDYDPNGDGGDAKEPLTDEGEEGKTTDDDKAGGEKDADDKEAGADEKEPVGVSDLSLIYRAAKLNLDMEAVNGFKSNEDLSRALDLVEKRGGVEDSNTGDGQEGGDDKDAPGDWYTPENLDERFDEETAEEFKKLNEGTQKAVKALFSKQSEEYKEQIQSLTNSLAGEFTAQFDEAIIERLGEDWVDIFGEGYGGDHKEGSPADQARMALWKEVHSGKHKGSIASRVVAAAESLHPDKVKSLAKKGLVKRGRDRQGRFLGRMDKRRDAAAAMSPTERATKAAADLMRKRGIMEEDFVETYESDDFL